MAIRDDFLLKILRYIKENGSMPKNPPPGLKQEDLHNHFTHLWTEGFITGYLAVPTGIDQIIRAVVDPDLTRKGLEFIKEDHS
jgi:hypothetical protein